MPRAEIGIIGGSGFYEIEGIKNVEEVKLETPFGSPSDSYFIGELEGKRVAFLSRHGRGHRLLPTEINFRANIYGFKMLGVERIISVSAVGSLKEKLAPLHMVLPDYFFDFTKQRKSTFFGEGLVAHVSFSQPVCPVLQGALLKAAEEIGGITIHKGGTYVCIEGPQFSTRAESEFYRAAGFDVIGMTNATEAKLAREAEICYVTLAMVTDYDCWHEEEEEVSVELVVENLKKNTANAKKLIKAALKYIPDERTCVCASALENAIITAPDAIPEEAKEKLKLIVGRYLK